MIFRILLCIVLALILIARVEGDSSRWETKVKIKDLVDRFSSLIPHKGELRLSTPSLIEEKKARIPCLRLSSRDIEEPTVGCSVQLECDESRELRYCRVFWQQNNRIVKSCRTSDFTHLKPCNLNFNKPGGESADQAGSSQDQHNTGKVTMVRDGAALSTSIKSNPKHPNLKSLGRVTKGVAKGPPLPCQQLPGYNAGLDKPSDSTCLAKFLCIDGTREKLPACLIQKRSQFKYVLSCTTNGEKFYNVRDCDAGFEPKDECSMEDAMELGLSDPQISAGNPVDSENHQSPNQQGPSNQCPLPFFQGAEDKYTVNLVGIQMTSKALLTLPLGEVLPHKDPKDPNDFRLPECPKLPTWPEIHIPEDSYTCSAAINCAGACGTEYYNKAYWYGCQLTLRHDGTIGLSLCQYGQVPGQPCNLYSLGFDPAIEYNP
ncbi:hypothetical protein N7492_008771 [Penicillium capsulatum]|uniref:Chitin-binding type-2 domain-containing protein n=1 Tax=Penicillium capsulatum TaxID=69766 RepID=A0A9W9LH96_9EURO|nr:hypothetical protein N7492_008771 [Penicillium capsulatum]